LTLNRIKHFSKVSLFLLGCPLKPNPKGKTFRA
jgi:hypothetical protein